MKNMQPYLHGILLLQMAKQPVNEHTLTKVLSAASMDVDNSLLIAIVSAVNAPDKPVVAKSFIENLKTKTDDELGLGDLFKE